jgi:ankyrin repeat protein
MLIIYICCLLFLGYIEFMEYLEKKGFDINIKNNYGDNCYLIACSNGQIEVMEYLEKKGFDINIKNNYGNNGYLYACFYGQIEIMKYLEKKGFNINIKNNIVNNAYLMACLNGQIKVMKYLEKKGIDINIKNQFGKNVFLILLKYNYNNNHIINYLNKIWYNRYFCNNINNKCVICNDNDNDNNDNNDNKYNKDDLYIKCNLNHYVHIECQKKLIKLKCIMCKFIY